MRGIRLPAHPASGTGRGLRASALAALCVLLPVAGHLLSRGHLLSWGVLAVFAGAAFAGSALLTRRRLSDAQLLAALATAQLVYHGVYDLPGLCRSSGLAGGHLPGLVGQWASGAPAWAAPVAHLVALLLAARFLGTGEVVLWGTHVLAARAREWCSISPPATDLVPAPAPRVRLHATGNTLRSCLHRTSISGRAPPRRAGRTDRGRARVHLIARPVAAAGAAGS
nr:hypothetical protein KPHV_86840 [Kitasatospora purpeofusca]